MSLGILGYAYTWLYKLGRLFAGVDGSNVLETAVRLSIKTLLDWNSS